MQAAISVGTSLLGALLGRKAISVGNAQRIGSAARSAGRLSKESGDVGRAQESRGVLAQRLADMQNELEAETSRLLGELDPQTVAIERSVVKPRKTDISVDSIGATLGERELMSAVRVLVAPRRAALIRRHGFALNAD